MKVLALLALFLSIAFAADLYKDLQIRNVARNIDLTGQTARHNIVLNVRNEGTQQTSDFYLALEESLASHLAYVSVVEESGASLTVGEGVTQQTAKNVAFRLYRVDLGRAVEPQDSIKLTVNYVFSHIFEPFPAEISQTESQLVRYKDNHFFFSPYEVVTQKTIVKLASSRIESSSEQAPTSVKGDTITYGPYQDIEPHQISEMSLHFENNKPLLSVTSLRREFEISHWGNLAVEEDYSMKHEGAKLQGPFSRFDYQRNPKAAGVAAVRSLRHILPLDARDFYYRDEIGNISTSNVFVEDRGVILETIPRYPIFGGWKTNFYMGYNLPLQHYLSNDVNDDKFFLLNVSFGKTFDSDVVIDELTVRIVLPEGVKDIEVHLPFQVDSQSRDVHYTYLDTYGRPVVVLIKRNAVAEHNQFFQVTYRFSRLSMLQEPILLIVAYLLFFLFMMVYVRIEFRINKEDKVKVDNSERISELLEKVKDIQNQRSGYHSTLLQASSKVGKSKNVQQFNNERKNIDLSLSECVTEVLRVITELDELDPALAAQVREIERQEKKREGHLNQLINLDSSYRTTHIPKAVHEESKASIEKLYTKTEEDIDRLVSELAED